VVVDGLTFPECPRWHGDRLWFSDTHEGRVHRFDPGTGRDEVAFAHSRPVAGLGFLPGGELVVVAANDQRLLRVDVDRPGGAVEYADLSPVAGSMPCNDMAVDERGRAYVGNFGFDILGGAPPAPADLALVHPDGTVEVAASRLMFPNGTIVTPDGSTLIVAETMAARLAAFDIGADGRLSHRRTFAEVEDMRPDGICLDAEGAVWVASPGFGAMRVHAGGAVSERIPTPGRRTYACVLGGSGRTTLFLCTGTSHVVEEARRIRSGKIEAVDVSVPGAGIP
jgi:sugar lactone lactonase YvrE